MSGFPDDAYVLRPAKIKWWHKQQPERCACTTPKRIIETHVAPHFHVDQLAHGGNGWVVSGPTLSPGNHDDLFAALSGRSVAEVHQLMHRRVVA